MKYSVVALLVAATNALTGVDVSQPIPESAWVCMQDPSGQGAVQWASVRALCSDGGVDDSAPISIKAARAAGI